MRYSTNTIPHFPRDLQIRQLLSNNCINSFRAPICGPQPLSGRVARSSRIMNPTPCLLHRRGFATSGTTRKSANAKACVSCVSMGWPSSQAPQPARANTRNRHPTYINRNQNETSPLISRHSYGAYGCIPATGQSYAQGGEVVASRIINSALTEANSVGAGPRDHSPALIAGAQS